MAYSFLIKDLGKKSYLEVLKLQEDIFNKTLENKKTAKKTINYLLFVEHFPVYTLGKNAQYSNVLFSPKEGEAKIIRVNRGGDVTFHGPGQLVIYPVFDLESYNLGLRKYIHTLEQVVINVLKEYNIKGNRVEGASGVWLDINTTKERKICAIGVRASRNVCMHGLAFNINTNLDWFSKIIPCGISNKGVTNLSKELKIEVKVEIVKKQFLKEFDNLFSKRFIQKQRQ